MVLEQVLVLRLGRFSNPEALRLLSLLEALTEAQSSLLQKHIHILFDCPTFSSDHFHR